MFFAYAFSEDVPNSVHGDNNNNMDTELMLYCTVLLLGERKEKGMMGCPRFILAVCLLTCFVGSFVLFLSLLSFFLLSSVFCDSFHQPRMYIE